MSARAHKDFEAAIRHMRRKRRSLVEKRRRNRQLLAAAGALLFAVGTATTVASLTGTDLAGAAAVRVQSLVDLIAKRSPGARTEAQLTKTKHRALAERDAPPVPHVPANLAEVIAPPAAAMVPVDLGPPPQLSFLEVPPLPTLFVPPPGGPPNMPPPGGGGGGCCSGPPSSPPETPPNTPPPPVPEPGTWLTMLLGFGFIGWAMRRKRAAAVFA